MKDSPLQPEADGGVRVQRVVGPPPDDDEMMAEAIRRCWNSGNMVIANRDEKGNVTMTEHELRRPNEKLRHGGENQ